MSRILIFGGHGQVARALQEQLGDRAMVFSPEQCDFSKPELVQDALRGLEPSAVINAAAYTAVDKAEEERDLAFRINAQSPRELALFCRARGIPLVHYSTDYVYDGSGTQPHREDETPAPLNAYGASKAAGDAAIMAVGGDYLILRTSWIYDHQGRNFLNTMLKLGEQREELRITADQFGAPTYAPHLAAATLGALDAAARLSKYPSGVYHCCNEGETTWFGFAQAIFAAARKYGEAIKVKNLEPIPASEYPLPAARPYNSRLDCSKLYTLLGVSLPPWERGLAECMERKYAGT